MATYAELKTLQTDETKRVQVMVAITIMAIEIAEESDNAAPYSQLPDYATAHGKRTDWVRTVNAFNPDDGLVSDFWNAMLASNEGLSVATIQAATDSSVLNNVKAVVDILAGN